jgi:hypothetical protein
VLLQVIAKAKVKVKAKVKAKATLKQATRNEKKNVGAEPIFFFVLKIDFKN